MIGRVHRQLLLANCKLSFQLLGGVLFLSQFLAIRLNLCTGRRNPIFRLPAFVV